MEFIITAQQRCASYGTTQEHESQVNCKICLKSVGLREYLVFLDGYVVVVLEVTPQRT